MKPLTIVIIVVVAAASFTAGYMTSTYRHRKQLEEAGRERAKKEAADFREAEKSFDEKLTIPKSYGR